MKNRGNLRAMCGTGEDSDEEAPTTSRDSKSRSRLTQRGSDDSGDSAEEKEEKSEKEDRLFLYVYTVSVRERALVIFLVYVYLW